LRRHFGVLTRSLTWVDLGVVAVLALVGAVRRRGMLPSSGLWFDDSWVAAGAVLGSPSELLTVGATNPTFTLLLMAVDRAGGGIGALALPAMVAGVATPVALYLLARLCRLGAPASLLAASILVVSRLPLAYSGRVKGYALEALVVVVLAGLVVAFARTRWGPSTVVAWVLLAWVLGGIGAPMLVATGIAAVILVLHPAPAGASHRRSDRRERLVALVVQGIGQLAFLVEARSRFAFGGIEEDTIEGLYDGYPTFDLHPVRLAREVAEHVARLGELYPGSSGRWAALAVVVAVGGLAWSAVRGRSRSEVLVARYLLALGVVALVGGLLGVIPFGVLNLDAVSPGGRFNLWLLPSLAFGAALVIDRSLGALPAAAGRAGSWVAVAGSVAVLAWGWFPPGPPAPYGGSATATAFLDAEIGPGDRVILVGTIPYGVAVSSDIPFEMVPTPHLAIAFVPVADDPRFLSVGSLVPSPIADDAITRHVDGADRVFTVVRYPIPGGPANLRPDLERAGFTPAASHQFDWVVVEEWRPAP
jgi:hypothetical protein